MLNAILSTLCVSGWLVAAAVLPAPSVLQWVAAGLVQAQQFDPSVSGKPNVLQKEPFNLLQKEPLFSESESRGGWLAQPSPQASSPAIVGPNWPS